MKVVKERKDDRIISRVLYKNPEEFEKDLGNALWAAEHANTVVEIWQNGDYFTLEYHSLKATIN